MLAGASCDHQAWTSVSERQPGPKRTPELEWALASESQWALASGWTLESEWALLPG